MTQSPFAKKITYGCNAQLPYVIQINFPMINEINFYNWDSPVLNDIEAKYTVAVWRVKKLKTRPEITLPDYRFIYN
jgi:hypothetical protein